MSCTDVKSPLLLELDERELLDEERIDEDTITEDDERLDDDTTTEDDERIDDEEDERIDDEDERTDEGVTEDVLPPQIAPFTTGVSIAPFPFTCTPNATVCPGEILPFQFKLDAL